MQDILKDVTQSLVSKVRFTMTDWLQNEYSGFTGVDSAAFFCEKIQLVNRKGRAMRGVYYL